ncbi:MAG TPA: CorA family divalent cation transporter [Pseudobdellovibrionaceae bacterium]|jgi:magnesium transporter
MRRFEHQWQEFKWIDIEGPSQEDFVHLANEFELPLRPLANCLDPEHLPRCEFFDSMAFFILRHFDTTAKESAGTMQDLTTKLVFVVGKDYVLTIHRASIHSINDEIRKCDFENLSLVNFMQSLCSQVIESFDSPIENLEAKTEIIEERVFALRRRNILREGYRIKRKTSAYRKLFKFTLDVLVKLQTRPDFPLNDISDIRESLDRLIFYVDNIYEDITGLLNLHLSLMSQKTNEASFKTSEIMRILTVVSIFFLPLNFIAGVYGMNFENMPELKNANGYHFALGAMLLIALAILLWIYKKGWLKKEDL